MGKFSPFAKQCFVTLGVTLNTMEQAVINGFSSVLVPQLRATKFIDLDEESESWIASIHNLSLMLGAFIVPSIMGRFGRKVANCLTAVILCLSWIGMTLCSDFYSLLCIKLIQGLCCGMIAIFAFATVGEYTSPKYRGAFLTTIATSYTIGMLLTHGLGAVLTWQKVAYVFGAIAFLDCVIIIFSPETPSFLATRGRFDECRKVFHWLRYKDEQEEVEKLIKSNFNKLEQRIQNRSRGCYSIIKRKVNYVVTMFQKREFYVPLILMFHLHLINEWSGATIIDAYTTDIYKRIVGNEVNMSMLIISTDVQRIITNFIAVIIIKKLSRRLMLIGTISINVAVYLLTAAYVFAKINYGLNLDKAVIGVMLIHLHVFCTALGSVPLPNIISGEIFALEYRGLSSMIALMFFALNVVINSKTMPYLFSTIGLHGAYCIYAGFVAYGLLVSWIMLPETKDRTLQEIEEKFRGKSLVPKKITETSEMCPTLSVDLEHNEITVNST